MKDLKSTFMTALKIRENEFSAVMIFAAYSTAYGTALIIASVIGHSMFLNSWRIEFLPLAYISAGILTILFSAFSIRIKLRLSFLKFTSISLIGSGIVFLTFATFMFYSDSPRLAFIFLVFCKIKLLTVIPENRDLADRIFSVRQKKRLSGLLSSIPALSLFTAGLLVAVLIRFTGSTVMVVSAAFFMLLSFERYTALLRSGFSNILSVEKEKPGMMRINRETKKGRYLKYFVGVSALSFCAYYLLDFVFYGQMVIHAKGIDATATYLAIVCLLSGLLSLGSTPMLYTGIISRFGLTGGLSAVPIIIGAAAIFSVTIGMTVWLFPFFFWLIIAIKLMDTVSRITIEMPSIRILHQPLSMETQISVKQFIESAVLPAIVVLSGAIMLVFKQDTVYAILLFPFFIPVWVYCVIRLRGEYTSLLANALDRRKLGETALSMDDASSVAVLMKGVRSEAPGEVIYSLKMLEEIEHDSFERLLIRLMEHKEIQVRRYVLERIGQLGLTKAIDDVKNRLEKETSSQVKGTVLKTLCSLAELDAYELVSPYMDHEDLQIRRGAMVGLLNYGGLDGVMSAGSNLNHLLNSRDGARRKLAAEVLGEVGISGFYRPLVKLLADDDPSVRRAAIEASGKLKNPKLLPILVKNFSIPHVGSAAVNAAASFGREILADLEQEFDSELHSRQVRKRLIRTIEKIGGLEAIKILKKKIDFPDEHIRTQVLSALVTCGYQAKGPERRDVIDRIKNEAESATRSLTILVDIGEYSVADLLKQALKNEITKIRKRILLLLTLIYPKASILSAEKNLSNPVAETRSRALKIIDDVVSSDIKSIVFPLFDDLSDEQRQSRLVIEFPQKHMSKHDRIKDVIAGSGQWTASWTKTCALFTIGRIATMEFYDTVISALSDPDPTVRETAIWALGRLNPDDLAERLQSHLKDKSPQVAALARFVMSFVGFAGMPTENRYLTRSGKYTADLFSNVLMDEREHRVRRCRAAMMLSRLGNNAAREALMDALTVPSKFVRSTVLESLVKGNWDVKDAAGQLQQLVRMEVKDAERSLSSMMVFTQDPSLTLIVDALRQEIDHNRNRLLLILALMDEKKQNIDMIRYWYFGRNRRRIPNHAAQTLADALMKIPDENLQKDIFVLFDLKSIRQLQQQWKTEFQNKRNNINARIERHLISIGFSSKELTGSWAKMCAIDAVGKKKLKSAIPYLIKAMKKEEDPVRTTAAEALLRIDTQTYQRHAADFISDVSHVSERISN